PPGRTRVLSALRLPRVPPPDRDCRRPAPFRPPAARRGPAYSPHRVNPPMPQTTPQTTPQTKPKRVLTARIMHETNTFSIVKTTMTDFRANGFFLGNEIPGAYRGTRSAMGGSFDAADKHGWSLVHPVSASANPAGLVTNAAFAELCGLLLDAAREQGPIDGALLHLHGAMVTEDHEDAEGELLRRLRGVIGPDAPVIVTLDLHANVTQAMVDNSSALIAFRTYPHIDQYER